MSSFGTDLDEETTDSDIQSFFFSKLRYCFIMAVIHVKKSEEVDTQIQGNQGKVVVIDYFADWCGPCVGFTPTFEKMSADITNAVFLKVNVDECPEAAESASIESIPAFHVYVNGVRKEVVVGASEAKLRDAIQKAQASL